MSTTALHRDAFAPRQPPGMRSGLALALLVHALLIVAIAWGVRWKASEPEGVVAELWSAVPQIAAPRPTPPPPEPKPAPVVEPKPVSPPVINRPAVVAPQVDAQIAIEKAKREQAKKQADEEARQLKAQQLAEQKAEKAEQAQRDKADAAKQKADADKAAKEKAQAEKAAAAKEEAERKKNLERILGQAGATGAATDTGTAARSSAPSADYGGRVAARIKPNINLLDPVDGNPRAIVEVKLAPDGTIISKRLVQSSGVKVWDDAVLRAIDRTGILPLDNGRVPPPFQIGFRPQD